MTTKDGYMKIKMPFTWYFSLDDNNKVSEIEIDSDDVRMKYLKDKYGDEKKGTSEEEAKKEEMLKKEANNLIFLYKTMKVIKEKNDFPVEIGINISNDV